MPSRSLTVHVDEAQLERRRTEWTLPEPVSDSRYAWLYTEHVLQADQVRTSTSCAAGAARPWPATRTEAHPGRPELDELYPDPNGLAAMGSGYP